MTKVSNSLFETRIGIKESTRERLVEVLNTSLADTLDVQSQAKYAHWNVKGSDFIQLHELFDKVAEHLEDAVDTIAERITALGGVANGSLRQAAGASTIPEYDFDARKGMDHVAVLADRLAKLANGARKNIDETAKLGDPATSDLFTELVREMDKDLYFLESHLQA